MILQTQSMSSKTKPTKATRGWVNDALGKIEADFTRSADTHLIPVQLPALDGISLYLKDESTHPTGSLKHRLARSLFLYGICNGWINEDTTIVEASSGSTAVSEAYFARLLDLPFIAVMPRATSKEKIEKSLSMAVTAISWMQRIFIPNPQNWRRR